ncbi:MAG: Gfo/Idh/MocA family oxidoreductase [Candidatus Marinimicrobia bacterium]|nr:Gfo/Idh/MocA family oxidoreductase [Candidatus Neomarinimicrobiota bacterium]
MKAQGANPQPPNKRMSRRKFIAGAGATALSFAIIKPELVRGFAANSKIDLGVIGCGDRGTWIADLFRQHGGFNIVAGADYFQDRVDQFGEKYQVGDTRLYTGLSGYRQLLDSRVDAVAIESPPYFHPEQAAATVDSGRHVYQAKPLGVDVPGCLSIAQSGKKATANQLCFLVDFQTRANALYREAVKRAQYGDIGPIVSGEATYHDGPIKIKTTPGSDEARLRNWMSNQALSGDIIVEQNIHCLDVATWILDDQPISAYGTGGRNSVGSDPNDYWDRFAVIYEFPNDVTISFNSKRFGRGHGGIICRMYGANGTIDTNYFGNVGIRGNTPYKGGSTGNLYTDGVVSNIADFYDNVTKGRFANTTVPPSVRSNLTAILGRMAGHAHRQVTWDEMMRANEKLQANLKGLVA